MTPANRTVPRPRDTIAGGRRKYTGAKAVGSFLPALTAPAFRKYGFSASSLITDWPAIIGRDLATVMTPERLTWPRAGRHTDDAASTQSTRTGATLVLRVDGTKALDIQYGTRQIIERINAFFGYLAVANLRIVQAPHTAPRPMPAARHPAEPRLDEVAMISDAKLREALAKLAGQVRASR